MEIKTLDNIEIDNIVKDFIIQSFLKTQDGYEYQIEFIENYKFETKTGNAFQPTFILTDKKKYKQSTIDIFGENKFFITYNCDNVSITNNKNQIITLIPFDLLCEFVKLLDN